jgi:hypothetical protein
MDKKIYSSYAFTENEEEKQQINRGIFQEIKDKAKVKLVKTGYASSFYEVVSNPENLSTLELALICDRGNLCFGYRTEGRKIVIHTD